MKMAECVVEAGVAYVDGRDDAPSAVLRHCLSVMRQAGYEPVPEAEQVYRPEPDLSERWSRIYFREVLAAA